MKTTNTFLRRPVPGFFRNRPRGFTLLELVVVIGIIALLATLSVPAFKGLGRGNTMANAQQQFVGDLNLARQQAIRLHTPVYVVFAPLDIWQYDAAIQPFLKNDPDPTVKRLGDQTRAIYKNLIAGQYASYALLTLHEVGSQPGQDKARYLSPGWKTLPDGVIFPETMFKPSTLLNYRSTSKDPNLTTLRTLPTGRFPFPLVTPFGDAAVTNALLPFLVFDSTGRLSTDRMNKAYSDTLFGGAYDKFVFNPVLDLTNSLSLGSVFVARSADGSNFVNQPADVLELPKTNSVDNRIVTSATTGRSRILRPQLK
ncbi:MAG TPA: GspH/FimT family pseudopilin [Candidatus Limnocylindria bacterium]|nr:GspH/FimT family pseudopilin [Candidatus Limnocylindria bacterium]